MGSGGYCSGKWSAVVSECNNNNSKKMVLGVVALMVIVVSGGDWCG